MNIKHLVNIVQAMRGLMPERNRSVLANALAVMITRLIEDQAGKTSKAAENWGTTGINRFFEACRLTEPIGQEPVFDIGAVDLDGFVQRWVKFDKWRPEHSESDDDWVPFTDEQNMVRHTMLRELRGMMDGKVYTPTPTKDEG